MYDDALGSRAQLSDYIGMFESDFEMMKIVKFKVTLNMI